MIDGSAVTGVLDVKVPAETPAAAVARFVDALRAELGGLSRPGTTAPRAVVVYAPDEVRDLTDAHGPVPSLALLLAVKDEFDPEHRMAPGRLADAVLTRSPHRSAACRLRHRPGFGHVTYASDRAYWCRWRR